MTSPLKPTLAVWKFTSCDGCQLSLLDCEDELLAVADVIEIAHFPEATRASKPGPYTLSLVEGSITTPEEVERIHAIRKNSTYVVAIGACACAGGLQALRNLAQVQDLNRLVYAKPEYISTLDKSLPIASYVPVDFELRGCPINKHQLLDVILSLLLRRKPRTSTHSVCVECKQKGQVCVMVAHQTPCLGPVTQAGCGAICPRYHRGCYGCFGHKETPNFSSMSLVLQEKGLSDQAVLRAFQSFHIAPSSAEKNP